MRTRVRPTRPLLTAVTATALSAALIAGGLPAHAATDPTGAPAPVAVPGTPAPVPSTAPADPAPAVPAAPAAVVEPTAGPTVPAAVDPADGAAPSDTDAPAASAPAPAPAPAAAPAADAAALPAPVLLTPAEGDAQVEDTTTFSGTGVAGATIHISVFAAGLRGGVGDAADFLHYSATVAPDGRWSTTETLPVGHWAFKADQQLGEEATATDGNIAFTVAPAAPRITTPTPDARVEGRLRLAGTGAAGSRTVLTVAGGDEPIRITTPVRADGTWSTEALVPRGEYAVTAVASHPLPYELEERYIESAPTGPVTVTVTSTAPAVRPVLLTPHEGDSQVEGTTTFSGTGEPNAGMTVYVFPEGDRDYASDAGSSLVFPTRVDADGRWSLTERLPIGIWIMKAEQFAGEELLAAESRPTFVVAPAAPVITTPTSGAHVSGRAHVAGTGTAGSRVMVTVTGSGTPRQLTADVRADGSWSVVADVPSGRYSVTAVGSHLLPYERSERYIRSGASAAVAFQVIGGTAVAVSHRTALPITGTDPVPLIALTGSLLAAGLALLVVPAVRRRRPAGDGSLPR